MSIEPALIAQLNDRDPHVSQSSQPHATASMALGCARAIGYKVAGVPSERPATLSTLLAFAIGNFVHSHVQEALRTLYPDFQDEVRFDRGAVTGRSDGLYTDSADHRVVLEIKTTNTKTFERARQYGPKPEHVLQASLSALAFDAPLVHLIYLAKADADDPMQEWVQTADLAGAAREERRMQRIVACVVAGEPVPRRMQGKVLDPQTTVFPCQWCDFKKRCTEEGE